MLGITPSVLVAIDLETTGLHPQLSEIVEIGAAAFVPETGEILATYQSLVNPGIEIPANVTAIHGITDAMVADSPRVTQAFESLEAFLAPYTIAIGHNITFDLGFLLHRAKLARRPLQLHRCIDTVHLARWAFPGLASYKLVSLRSSLGLPADSAHRALDDAVASAALFTRGYPQLLRMGHSPDAIWMRLIKPLPEPRPQPMPLTEEVRALYLHCERGTRLLIRYRNAQHEISLRVVDAQGMQMQHSGHTLVGFCHLKQATRHFRCDRILAWEDGSLRSLEEMLALQSIVPPGMELEVDPPIEVFGL